MSGKEIILKYFHHLSHEQQDQYERMGELYRDWNDKINLVSRKDIENLYERHILHSLAIAKVVKFTPGSRVMDVGTGGGFPAIPLAVMFPETEFIPVDSIGKKIKVVEAVAKALGLKNIHAYHSRADDVPGKFDFITGRAVTDINVFYGWVKKKISQRQQNALPNGILYLKGGDLSKELKPFRSRAQVLPISGFFEEEFFETKSVVYVEALE